MPRYGTEPPCGREHRPRGQNQAGANDDSDDRSGAAAPPAVSGWRPGVFSPAAVGAADSLDGRGSCVVFRQGFNDPRFSVQASLSFAWSAYGQLNFSPSINHCACFFAWDAQLVCFIASEGHGKAVVHCDVDRAVFKGGFTRVDPLVAGWKSLRCGHTSSTAP